MPRVRPLGKPDYDKIFGAEIDCAITRSFRSKGEIAGMTGISSRMLYYKIKTPKSISLEWLKLFIKATNIKPEVILDYLYEGKWNLGNEEEKGA